MRLSVAYTAGQRSDAVYFPSNGWHKLPAGESEWKVRPDKFCGGAVTAYCRTSVDGQQVKTRATSCRRSGRESTKAGSPGCLGSLATQVVAFQESRFAQFGHTSDLATLTPYRKGPFEVLSRSAGRFGLGQLTEPLRPEQLWNWRENATETVRRLTELRDHAWIYQTQVQNGLPWNDKTGGRPPNEGVAYPDAPAFTEDQLDLEMWSRYQDGLRYHDYVDSASAWARRTDRSGDQGSLDYADELRGLCDAVLAGDFPEGWEDPDPKFGHERRDQVVRPGLWAVTANPLGTVELVGPTGGLFTKQQEQFPDPLRLKIAGRVHVGGGFGDRVGVRFAARDNPALAGAVNQSVPIEVGGFWEVSVTLFFEPKSSRSSPLVGTARVEGTAASGAEPILIENARLDWFLETLEREEQRLALADRLAFLARVRKVLLPLPYSTWPSVAQPANQPCMTPHRRRQRVGGPRARCGLRPNT